MAVPERRLSTEHTGVLVRFVEFERADLVVAVNETAAPAVIPIGMHGERRGGRPAKLRIPPGSARMAFVDKKGRLLDSSHPME